jgi:hypothetical protein
MDRDELLAHLYAGRERFLAAMVALPRGSMLDRVDDEWTRKDVVAHLEAWERRVVELFERLRRGELPQDSGDTDQLNALLHAADRFRSLEDVIAGETNAWQRLIAMVESATDDELFDPEHFAWTEGDPFVGWVRANADQHIDEHLDQLTRRARATIVAV